MECAYPASRDPQFNLTGGPTGAAPATLAALGRPILHHLDPAFGEFYQQTAGLLQRAFETSQSPVILPGEAVVGLEAAAASLIGPRVAPARRSERPGARREVEACGGRPQAR